MDFLRTSTLSLVLLVLLLSPPLVLAQSGSANTPAGTEDWPETTEQNGQDAWGESWDDDWTEDETPALPFNGFLEAAYGTRLHRNPWVDRHDTLNEARLRLEYSDYLGSIYASYKGDFLVDDLAWKGPLVEARTREALLRFSPSQNSDVQLGRQILTWGTGDLLFLNDLFPKDWVSFFAGREMEYLKAPSDALKLSYFHQLANIDLVWTPIFDHDNYIRGERFSYFSPLVDSLTAAPPPVSVDHPDSGLDDGELALRIHKLIDGYEWAFYAYHGYFKNPFGFDPDSGLNYFPRLSSWGASVRGGVGPGIGNLELAWYLSRDDSGGSDPFIPNSQLRFLSGYEQELITRLTLGLQYYMEWTQDYDALKEHSLEPEKEPEEYRHLVTSRLTYRSSQDKLTLSLFVFYSPSDDDFFAMPKASYRVSDAWSTEVGMNILGGQENFSFFGQFEENSSAYARIRYSF